MRVMLAAATALTVTISLAGCGQQQGDAERSDSPTVIASTDVWGSVAQAVVGDRGTVTSILTSSVDDPHSYEASPADAAEISDASLVVFNGGGYDHWVEDVLANSPDVPRVDAYALLPDVAQHPNEHVFYDAATVKAAAAQIAEQLGKINAADAETYRANAATFGDAAAELLTAERAIGQAHPGASVVATEPVAHYLLVNAGIADKTPPGFAEAVEQDTDPSPADLAAMLDLINSRQVSALIYNPQTETSVTKQLRDAAASAAIPVVNVTETLPAGTDYLSWQRQTVQDLAGQLDKAPAASR
jgi:zinc/manganese transport system substrate-binding protein